jgi:hypothetical protein
MNAGFESSHSAPRIEKQTTRLNSSGWQRAKICDLTLSPTAALINALRDEISKKKEKERLRALIKEACEEEYTVRIKEASDKKREGNLWIKIDPQALDRAYTDRHLDVEEELAREELIKLMKRKCTPKEVLVLRIHWKKLGDSIIIMQIEISIRPREFNPDAAVGATRF